MLKVKFEKTKDDGKGGKDNYNMIHMILNAKHDQNFLIEIMDCGLSQKIALRPWCDFHRKRHE